jgi:hypothetical protein
MLIEASRGAHTVNIRAYLVIAAIFVAAQIVFALLCIVGLLIYRRRVRATTPAGTSETLDRLANRAGSSSDRIDRVLFPAGPPTTKVGRKQVFRHYKLMVQTSESLISRRQGTNTFFITLNGALLTAIGLFVRNGYDPRSHGLVIAILCVTGIVISWAWRTLLISFGQLNKGKFAVILRLEKVLGTATFDAEWEALDRGEDKRTYRSFTKSESRIPIAFSIIYAVAGLVGVLIALGWFWKV